MSNYEFYKDEIIEAFLNNSACEFVATHTNIIKHDCTKASMNECAKCDKTFREWLNAEYKAPVTISKIEFTILNEIDDKWKYIARDSEGDLYLYEDRPDKGVRNWIDHKNNYYHHFYAFNELFKLIKWEYEEPYEIAKLIADYEKDNVKEEVEENE